MQNEDTKETGELNDINRAGHFFPAVSRSLFRPEELKPADSLTTCLRFSHSPIPSPVGTAPKKRLHPVQRGLDGIHQADLRLLLEGIAHQHVAQRPESATTSDRPRTRCSGGRGAFDVSGRRAPNPPWRVRAKHNRSRYLDQGKYIWSSYRTHDLHPILEPNPQILLAK